MKRFNSTLLMFMRPAILVASLAAAINLGTLFIFNQDQQNLLSLVNPHLGVITEASGLVVDIGHLHRSVSSVLDDAAEGKLDEAGVYRIHSRIVNDLAALDQRIRKLRQNANDLGVSSSEIDALQQDFDAYRIFVITSTDIASIDPKAASHFISKAQQEYLSFAQNAHSVSSLLAERNRSKITTSLATSKFNLISIIEIGSIGLAAMLGLSYFSAARLSQRMGKVIGALRILARKDVEPPPLPEMVEIRNQEDGDIKAIADAVLSFREALIEQKTAETEIRIAATAFESQEGMLIADANHVILRVNSAFTEITGYTAEEVVGKDTRILNSGRQDASFYDAMWEKVNNEGAWKGEIWNRRKNGEIYPENLTITAVKNQDGVVTNYVASHTDITSRKESERQIQHLAFYDPLTELPNRRLLLDRLHHALAASGRSGRQGALLFIDLDNFKDLNDTLGHDKGDLLLKQVAERLTSCVREGDSVARLGGDEFVVVLEDLSTTPTDAAAQAEMIGEKVLANLSLPYRLATHEYHCTPSIGAVLFNDKHQVVEELLKQADIAMYQAKKAGRNTLRFFDPQMQETVNARAALEGELRKAIDYQQFQLFYQIQVDGSHHPRGAEALIRWIHPDHGVVPPTQFISLAEETGLIVPIGQWVLESACAQLKAWEQAPLTRRLVLAVNVSPKQFRQTDFASQVRAAVRHHGINPTLLKLELTESMLLENVEETIATMNALKAIGVRFSLDDFGTGYSSLQYLKRLPLDQLKIDQSFVRDIATNTSDKTIVRTIIAMARSLNLDLIAEGVETQEQHQRLLSKGCCHFQGFLFGEPAPIEKFDALLTKSMNNVVEMASGHQLETRSTGN